ncbi:NAD(P)/FAD-dependent oxidoreductase [Paracoccus sp. KR1-242]|uniref:NAD(P)/FAD-dependent oxidoreductase n=1 Tax=Paracoccus sp. KR1-242 TaxID=3410028 RepID=UPI003C02EA4E
MPPHSADTIIIGGGTVGLCAAVYLQRSGRNVMVIDPLPSPGGASFGNAGMISPDTAVPISLPGMLRKVPGWLMDPMGPLVVRPAYFARAFPWLMKWISAGRWTNVLNISDAMRSLHKDSFAYWRELVGEAYGDLIRNDGQVHLWESEHESLTAAREREIRERHGIEARALTRDEISDLFPDMATGPKRAVFVPGNGYTVSPARLVRKLEEIFLKGGGQRVHDQVGKVIPAPGGRNFTVLTGVGNFTAPNVVVCAGAHSARLLEPLAVSVPLEIERGYHIMLRDHGLRVGTTLSNKSRSFGLTPMADGLRVAGTVEISGLDTVPDERRAFMLTRQLKQSFPSVNVENLTFWAGMRPSLPDSLPVIEESARHPGLFLNFGHSHFGMTGGPGSGLLLSQIMNREKPFTDPAAYSLQRKTIRLLS